MKFKRCIAVIGLVLFSSVASNSQAQQNNKAPWKNKQAAVVLTYDDALNIHHTNAITALDKLGFKGTFYICNNSGQLRAQLPKWRAAAAKGHELGNHTVYHPCIGDRPGREFVKADYNLNNYSFRRIVDEIKTMNTLLHAMDGKTKRTFAFPCSDTKIRDTPYLNGAQNEFVAARAVRGEMPLIDKVDLLNVPSYSVNGQTAKELIELVKQAINKKAMLVFLFHGVGGEHSLNVSLEAHTKLLQFIKAHEKELWIAPMIDVAEYVKAYQDKRSSK